MKRQLSWSIFLICLTALPFQLGWAGEVEDIVVRLVQASKSGEIRGFLGFNLAERPFVLVSQAKEENKYDLLVLNAPSELAPQQDEKLTKEYGFIVVKITNLEATFLPGQFLEVGLFGYLASHKEPMTQNFLKYIDSFNQYQECINCLKNNSDPSPTPELLEQMRQILKLWGNDISKKTIEDNFPVYKDLLLRGSEGYREFIINLDRNVYLNSHHTLELLQKTSPQSIIFIPALSPFPTYPEMRIVETAVHESFHIWEGNRSDVGGDTPSLTTSLTNKYNTDKFFSQAIDLEYHFLSEALKNETAIRKEALKNFVQVRKFLREHYPEEMQSIDTLEYSEGLAEYAVLKIFERAKLKPKNEFPAFLDHSAESNIWCYQTGAMLGVLLDSEVSQWQRTYVDIKELTAKNALSSPLETLFSDHKAYTPRQLQERFEELRPEKALKRD